MSGRSPAETVTDAALCASGVEVLRTEGDRAWIREGVVPGERVVVQVQGLLRDGMEVRLQSGEGVAARVPDGEAAGVDP